MEGNTEKKKRNKLAEAQLDLSAYGKIPPQALDLEEAILGALMLDQDAVTNVIDLVKEDMFYKEAHRKIFSAIHALFADSQPLTF